MLLFALSLTSLKKFLFVIAPIPTLALILELIKLSKIPCASFRLPEDFREVTAPPIFLFTSKSKAACISVFFIPFSLSTSSPARALSLCAMPVPTTSIKSLPLICPF